MTSIPGSSLVQILADAARLRTSSAIFLLVATACVHDPLRTLSARRGHALGAYASAGPSQASARSRAPPHRDADALARSRVAHTRTRIDVGRRGCGQIPPYRQAISVTCPSLRRRTRSSVGRPYARRRHGHSSRDDAGTLRALLVSETLSFPFPQPCPPSAQKGTVRYRIDARNDAVISTICLCIHCSKVKVIVISRTARANVRN